MRSLPALLALLLASAPVVRADQAAAPVLLELYTSQGCIACPPADALLSELAGMDGVVALALHVDYWDYMGWKDHFARPSNTERQQAYAAAAGSRTLYTPQMVVQGETRVKGHDSVAVRAEILRRQSEVPRAAVFVERSGEKLVVRLAPSAGPVGPADVQLVTYLPSETVAIEKGENAGQTITYINIVTDWQNVGWWDGTRPIEMVLEDAPEGPVAVVVQEASMGPVIAAAMLP